MMANPQVVMDAESAARAAETFPQYRKLRSWLALFELGLPTLRGVIINDWSERSQEAVNAFLSIVGVDRLTLRSDSAGEGGNYPPGGNTVASSVLAGAVQRYLSLGRILFLLEPRSRFNDLYSIAVGFFAQMSRVIEAVGPGFDMSDLNRGDASPHEWWECARLGSGNWRTINHGRIAESEYRDAWTHRRDKVARLAGLIDDGEPNGPAGVRRDQVFEWLLRRDETLLFDHRVRYPPLPEPLFDTVLEHTHDLPARLGRIDCPAGNFVVSMSFFGRQAAPIYWDVAWGMTTLKVRTLENQ